LEELSLDSAAVIINETAVRKMELKDPIGTRLIRPDENGKYTYHTIIGVVKDFHFKSLHDAIQPYIILLRPKSANWVGYLSIRLDKGDKAKYIYQIENTWHQFTGNRPLEYSFLDEDLKRFYLEEKKTGNLSLIFTVLAIFIACLGLLGLVSFTTMQRTKEIGLRKTMGATVWSIIVLLSSKTVKLLIISSLLAWPVAYFFLKNWLQDFIFRVGLNPQIFILTSLIVLGLSLFTIGFQTWIAATRNPVDSLRYE
jgi:putative ABC transport system permease protein